MSQKKIKLSIALFLVLRLTVLQAQESVIATGGNASGSGGSANYSVGQVVYTTNTGNNGYIAQGVQQAYEISVVKELEKAKDIMLYVSVYPNPTTDYLTLEVKDFEFSSLNYKLYNMQCKLLEYKKIKSNQTKIIMSNYVPSTYFIKINKGDKVIKTIRIIKY